MPRGALTSSSSRTTSVLPQRAASCSAVPALVCRLMSMPACSRSLRGDSGVSGARGGHWHCPPCPRHAPDDVDVAVLGGEVQGAGAVGVGGVPRFGLQQGRAHVAVQEQLDHLAQQTQTEQGCKGGSAAPRGCSPRPHIPSCQQPDLPCSGGTSHPQRWPSLCPSTIPGHLTVPLSPPSPPLGRPSPARAYPDPAKLACQVQGRLPRVVHDAGVGLVLQEHLRLGTGKTPTR